VPDEFYGPLVKASVPFNMYDRISRKEGQDEKIEWAKKFCPNRILLVSGMKIEEIENFYKWLSFLAREKDPLHKWFMLQQLVKNSRRYELKNEALLASTT
jgi:hypothetical protein